MINTQHSWNDFSANGSTAVFDFDFFALAAGHVFALVNGVEAAVRVRLNSDHVGGEATLHAVPESGAKVRIERRTPRVQSLDLVYNSALPAESIEEALDRSMCCVQESDNAMREFREEARALMELARGPQGEPGPRGLPGGSYLASAFTESWDAPSAPPEGTLGPTPEGWSDSVNPDAVLPIWCAQARCDSEDNPLTPWRVFRVTGNDGGATVMWFRRGVTAPDKPEAPPHAGGVSWIPDGWEDGPSEPAVIDTPDGKMVWWMSKAYVNGGGYISEPSVPIPWTGLPGENGQTMWLARVYSVSASAPERPSGESPEGWSGTIPSVPEGGKLWMCEGAMRLVNGVAQLVSGWSEPVCLVGEQGVPGDYLSIIFKSGKERPGKPTFTTSEPGGADGWFDVPPVVTPEEEAAGVVTWFCEGWISGETDNLLGGYEWSGPAQYNAVSGVDGDDGLDGQNVYLAFTYSLYEPGDPTPNVPPLLITDDDTADAGKNFARVPFDADGVPELPIGWTYKTGSGIANVSGEGVAVQRNAHLWMQKCVVTVRPDAEGKYHYVQRWTAPARISGESGEWLDWRWWRAGVGGQTLPIASAGVLDPPGWEVSPPSGDGTLYAITCYKTGQARNRTVTSGGGITYPAGAACTTSWSAAFRVSGEAGTPGRDGTDARGTDGISSRLYFYVGVQPPNSPPTVADLHGWTLTPQMNDVNSGQTLWMWPVSIDSMGAWQPQGSAPQCLNGPRGAQGDPGSAGTTRIFYAKEDLSDADNANRVLGIFTVVGGFCLLEIFAKYSRQPKVEIPKTLVPPRFRPTTGGAMGNANGNSVCVATGSSGGVGWTSVKDHGFPGSCLYYTGMVVTGQSIYENIDPESSLWAWVETRITEANQAACVASFIWPYTMESDGTPVVFGARGQYDKTEGDASFRLDVFFREDDGLEFAWVKDDMLIEGANVKDYIVGEAEGAVALSDAGVYRLRITNSSGTTATHEIVVNVAAKPEPPANP